MDSKKKRKHTGLPVSWGEKKRPRKTRKTASERAPKRCQIKFFDREKRADEGVAPALGAQITIMKRRGIRHVNVSEL